MYRTSKVASPSWHIHVSSQVGVNHVPCDNSSVSPFVQIYFTSAKVVHEGS